MTNQPKGAHLRTVRVIGLVIKSDRYGQRSVMDECLSGDEGGGEAQAGLAPRVYNGNTR